VRERVFAPGHPATSTPGSRTTRLANYRRHVLRTALQPRWLALLAVVLVVCVGFGWLGSWQLGVARDRGEVKALREARSRPAVPIDEVLAPQRAFTAAADGRRVTVQGTYDPSKQVLVSGRVQPGGDGTVGWWVVGALRTSTDAWLPVVRGWVPDPEDAAAGVPTPSGPVTVQGVLQPDEPPAQASGPVDGRLTSLDVADLVNRWGTPIYNGFLVLTSQRPDVPADEPRLELVPAPQPVSHGIAWRNAAYAVQWWVFAGFTLVMWWKMVQQAARDEADARGEEAQREHTAT
jgi:surfeit locus 1 family protein